MAELTTGKAVGSQATTQNPQTVPTQTLGSTPTQSKGVQPGTAQQVLTSSNGISLGGTAVTTVNLNPTTAATVQADVKPPAPAKHHVNAGLLGLSIGLVLVAVIVFWIIGRTAKSTTD